MQFSSLYDRLERARWDMNSVPLDAVDLTKVDEELIHNITQVTLTELSALAATKMFIRDFEHDVDFQRFVAVWSFEEAKHSLILERWLKKVGVEIPEHDMKRMMLTFEPGPWIETLTMHFLGEQKLGTWYRAFAGLGEGSAQEGGLPEPVLRHIFTLMGNDELRHAGAYFSFLKEAVAETPDHLANIGRMFFFMLRGRYKHPTNITKPSIMEQLDDPGYNEDLIDRFLTKKAEIALEKRVLDAYSHLAKVDIPDMKTLLKYLRNRFGKDSTDITLHTEHAPALILTS